MFISLVFLQFFYRTAINERSNLHLNKGLPTKFKKVDLSFYNSVYVNVLIYLVKKCYLGSCASDIVLHVFMHVYVNMTYKCIFG